MIMWHHLNQFHADQLERCMVSMLRLSHLGTKNWTADWIAIKLITGVIELALSEGKGT